MGVKQFTYEDLNKAMDATSEKSYKIGFRDGMLTGLSAVRKSINDLEKAVNAEE